MRARLCCVRVWVELLGGERCLGAWFGVLSTAYLRACLSAVFTALCGQSGHVIANCCSESMPIKSFCNMGIYER